MSLYIKSLALFKEGFTRLFLPGPFLEFELLKLDKVLLLR